MQANDDGVDLWRFLGSLSEAAFLRRATDIRRTFAGPPLDEASPELRAFTVYLRNRFFVNVDRLSSGRRQGRRYRHDDDDDRQRTRAARRQLFARQVDAMAKTRDARSIRFFLALLMSFRESGRWSGYMQEIGSSFWEGGLDGLYDNQDDYRRRGVLPDDVAFGRGYAYGHPNDETPDPTDEIRDARVPAGQLLVAYGARVGYAAQMVRQRIAERQAAGAAGWRPDFQGAPLVCQNVMIALAAAAQGGIAFEPWSRRSNVQGFGIVTLVDYLAERDLPVSAVTGVLDWDGGPGARAKPFRITRMFSAVRLGVGATALREMFNEFMQNDREVEAFLNSIGAGPLTVQPF